MIIVPSYAMANLTLLRIADTYNKVLYTVHCLSIMFNNSG